LGGGGEKSYRESWGGRGEVRQAAVQGERVGNPERRDIGLGLVVLFLSLKRKRRSVGRPFRGVVRAGGNSGDPGGGKCNMEGKEYYGKSLGT